MWLWHGISHTIALRDQVCYLNIINWVTYASFNMSVELFRFYRLLFVGLLAQLAPWEHWALKRSVNVLTEENLRCCTVNLMQLDCCLIYFYNLINKSQWLPSNCEKFNVFNWLVIAHFFYWFGKKLSIVTRDFLLYTLENKGVPTSYKIFRSSSCHLQ